MNIWLLGQSGFIGRHIAQALHSAGHTIVARPRIDMAQATTTKAWLPHLNGVDAVINAVGVLRDSRRRPIWSIHAYSPQALFDACAHIGLEGSNRAPKVIQISALGIVGNPTQYAQSKLAADQHLLALLQSGQLNAVVLRPSIVIGPGGASTQLFLRCAQLPVLPLPQPVHTTPVQPMHVEDLAHAVCAALSAHVTGLHDLAGPDVVTLATLIAHWRAALGKRPALQCTLPRHLSVLSARLGDRLPWGPWCSETLALLAQPNTAAPDHLTALLSHPARAIQNWPQESPL